MYMDVALPRNLPRGTRQNIALVMDFGKREVGFCKRRMRMDLNGPEKRGFLVLPGEGACAVELALEGRSPGNVVIGRGFRSIGGSK